MLTGNPVLTNEVTKTSQEQQVKVSNSKNNYLEVFVF
jgi:hypothetical protein